MTCLTRFAPFTARLSAGDHLSLDPKAIWSETTLLNDDPVPLVDAAKATFLVGSDIPGVMTQNSKVAYGSPEAAAAAQKAHGGQLMDFKQVLKVSFTDLSDDLDRMRNAREERRKRAAKQKQAQ
jgi:hypothetical protein